MHRSGVRTPTRAPNVHVCPSFAILVGFGALLLFTAAVDGFRHTVWAVPSKCTRWCCTTASPISMFMAIKGCRTNPLEWPQFRNNYFIEIATKWAFDLGKPIWPPSCGTKANLEYSGVSVTMELQQPPNTRTMSMAGGDPLHSPVTKQSTHSRNLWQQ